MQDQGTDRLLTTGEVARAFFVDPKTVTKWADAGKLAHVRTPGNHRRFRESDVFALLRGAPADLNTLLNRAREVADRIEFNFRSNMVDAIGDVAVIAWKGDVSEYATAATPGEALTAAVDKLAAYLAGGAR